MDFQTLLQRYQSLLAENKALREENRSLRQRLGLGAPVENRSCSETAPANASHLEESCRHHPGSDPEEKIRLFMSLFRGREDLYARRWESRNGRSGYAPVCLNEWKQGICGKPAIKCAACEHRAFAGLDEKVIEAHLRGRIVVGIYPLCQDDTCHFLAIDFDGDGWQEDVSALREVCSAFAVPIAITQMQKPELARCEAAKLALTELKPGIY